MRGTRGVRTPLKNSTSVFRGSRWRDHCFPAPLSWFLLNAELSWRPEDHFCKLFVIEMSPERHEKSERRPPVSWRPCAGVQPRSSVQLVTYHACQRSGTTCCSASDHLKESHDTAVKAQGKATGQRDKVTSVSVSCGWFESCSCWFPESASELEVKHRENEEKLKSLVHYIVFCGKQNILRGHPTEKVNQATASRLSSASDGPGIVLFDKEAGFPGNSIALSFKPKLMLLLYWGIFIAILIREENRQVKHLSPLARSRMSWLTVEENP